ncbi:FAD/NAD(P)-binding protein [Algoriphagus sp.]|uniref:FAD/NAD(P)-binding protein n=1 Tax=Algoriphagus sp. TaxID=1872435 RepID=UPI00391D04D8
MIWNSKNISSQINQAETFIDEYIFSQSLPDFADKSIFRTGIIGGGPKGLYALDTLLNSLATVDLEEAIEIYWFNEGTNFGCGPNFDPHQPDYLLINTCIGQIDAWNRDTEESVDTDFPNLVQWLKSMTTCSSHVRPTDFASRALVGRYLQEVACRVIKSVPAHVKLFLLVDSVQEIKECDGFRLRLSRGEFPFPMDNILMTTGHCYSNSCLINDGENFLQSKTYFSGVWTADRLDSIEPGSRVGIAGMGLTFIDISLHLTEGRGGAFVENGDYIPSGREPIIYPFSRSGQPILPRTAAFGSGRYQLQFLNKEWLQEFRKDHDLRKVDFFEEILPLIEREISFAYYRTLIGTANPEAIDIFLSDIHPSEKFDLHRLLFGMIEGGGNRHQTILDFLENVVIKSKQGELNSPLLAAMAVWREAVSLVGEVYSHGGLTGDSQRKLDHSLLGAFNRTSFGPPVENMKKILALAKAGIIQFDVGAGVEVTINSQNGYVLTSGKATQNIDFLIDARVARPQIEKENSPLYRQLLETNLIEPYSNEGYLPGCVSMDISGQTTVNSPNSPAIFFYGSNTEGVLLDNDSLSRTRNNLAKPWAEFALNQFIKLKYTQNELSF